MLRIGLVVALVRRTANMRTKSDAQANVDPDGLDVTFVPSGRELGWCANARFISSHALQDLALPRVAVSQQEERAMQLEVHIYTAQFHPSMRPYFIDHVHETCAYFDARHRFDGAFSLSSPRSSQVFQ